MTDAPTSPIRCAVIGAGAWGTALAHVLRLNGHDVGLWARETDVAESICARHENDRYLTGHLLAPGIAASTDMRAVLEPLARVSHPIIVFATPSEHARSAAHQAAPMIPAGAIMAVASKGIEHGSLGLMTDVIANETRSDDVVAVSGPSFADEVVEGAPTAIVAAARKIQSARRVQEAFSNTAFRIYTHDDVTGVELGGALKNVMAVAAGIVDGAGLGLNARAALITRGLAEMTRLGVALGADPATFAGLAGLGDLVLTCTGGQSRNRAVGFAVGGGATLAQALEGKPTVAEGVVTARSAAALASRVGVTMPIVEMVNRILFDGYPARDAVRELMARELRPEQDA